MLYLVGDRFFDTWFTSVHARFRLTAHFLVMLGQGELRKQWTWEPRMGESLILSLFDSSDVMQYLFLLFPFLK